MFIWTGAAVDVPYKVYKLLGHLGFKIYFFRLPYKEKTQEELLEHMKGRFNKKKANIQSALYEYLGWFEIGPDLIHDEQNGLTKMQWDDDKDDKSALLWIIELARLLSHLRCIAQTWTIESDNQGSNYGYTHTQPESPERAIEVLRNLARGHALLTGRNYITLEDIPIVVKTVLSTAIIDRVGLVRLLMAKGGTVTTTDVAGALKVTNKTALRNMTELKVIGLVDIKDEDVSASYNNPPYKPKRITLKEEFQWLLSEDFKKLSEGFEPVDNRSFMEKKSVSPTKEKTTNKIPFSPVQMSTFSQILVKLEYDERRSNPGIEVDNPTILEEKLQDALVSIGNFNQSDAAMIIEYMKHEEVIEQVDTITVRRKVRL